MPNSCAQPNRDCAGAWQTPIASQQVVGLMVDALRAGVTTYSAFDPVSPYGDGSAPLVPLPKPIEADPPDYGGLPPMLMYVMAHFPGNNPIMWKRRKQTPQIRFRNLVPQDILSASEGSDLCVCLRNVPGHCARC